MPKTEVLSDEEIDSLACEVASRTGEYDPVTFARAVLAAASRKTAISGSEREAFERVTPKPWEVCWDADAGQYRCKHSTKQAYHQVEAKVYQDRW